MKNIKIKGLDENNLGELTLKKLGCIEGGKTQGNINVETGHIKIAGSISLTKRWKENRENELIHSSDGGKTAVKQKKGCHSLTKKELSKAGKLGYSNGLGKLSIKQKIKIASNAGLVNREKNATLKVKDVIFMRKHFIPRHPQFGVVAFSKKYGVAEGTIRSAIKRKSFKDIK
jgi:hypothetical protein